MGKVNRIVKARDMVLTDFEKMIIETAFFCTKCEQWGFNINCNVCLPIKADKINDYLSYILQVRRAQFKQIKWYQDYISKGDRSLDL